MAAKLKPSTCIAEQEGLKSRFVKQFQLKIKYRFLACAFLALTGCSSTSIYKVVSDEVKLSISPSKKVFLIREADFPKAEGYIKLINNHDWTGLDKALARMNDQNGKHFLQAIALLIQENYQAALTHALALPDDAFECQARILKTDCLHELNNPVDFRREYQLAFDCSSDKTVKSVAETRFRFIKYGR